MSSSNMTFESQGTDYLKDRSWVDLPLLFKAH